MATLVFDSAMFANKMLVALVRSQLSQNEQTEQIALIKWTNGSFSQSLDLSADATEWLQEKLGLPLVQIFCRSKIVDISKLAKESSRYFSLWLDKHNSCMFFSSAAVRNLLKSLDAAAQPVLLSQVLRIPVLDQLREIKDWTSKDLLNIIINAF